MDFNRSSHWWLKDFAYVPSPAVKPTDLSPVLVSRTKSKPFCSLGFLGAREEGQVPIGKAVGF